MASRILAIDDDPYNLDLFRLLLQPDGYEVILSESAYQDMAEVEAIHPDHPRHSIIEAAGRFRFLTEA